MREREVLKVSLLKTWWSVVISEDRGGEVSRWAANFYYP